VYEVEKAGIDISPYQSPIDSRWLEPADIFGIRWQMGRPRYPRMFAVRTDIDFIYDSAREWWESLSSERRREVRISRLDAGHDVLMATCEELANATKK
jgi:hypothetical protein